MSTYEKFIQNIMIIIKINGQSFFLRHIVVCVWIVLNVTLSYGSLRIDSIPTKLYAFCGTGDHLWSTDKEPIDSKATVEAMIEWMSETYDIKRLYWRGGQEDIWLKNFKFGSESVQHYDYKQYSERVYGQDSISSVAINAAKKHGMEIFLYTALYEAGVQPDVGVISPYLFEDSIRIKHPEWTSVDRWGQRRAPGLISFCYPEARKMIIDRLMKSINENNYDGINLYTYVENLGIRYIDEFGYNQPVVDEFNKKYPNVDLRKDKLSASQKLYWYKCRGKFTTIFLQELSLQLHKNDKKLSVIIDAIEPDFAQPWWGKIISGTGMIYMDWRKWIKEGIVDELWIQLADFDEQKRTLDMILKEVEGTKVKLTVRTPNPLSSKWQTYIERGVNPVAVITWPNNNGIEKYSLGLTSEQSLTAQDWKLRLQTLEDVINRKLVIKSNLIAKLSKDPNVLVRRKCMLALGSLKDPKYIPIIEHGLFDSESSVRVAAAVALKDINNLSSVSKILKSVSLFPDFPLKIASSNTLSNIKYFGIVDSLKSGLNNPYIWVREVCVRSISDNSNITPSSRYVVLRSKINDSSEDYRIRWWALKGLTNIIPLLSNEEFSIAIKDIQSVLKEQSNPALNIQACEVINKMASRLSSDKKQTISKILSTLFSNYGNRCTRSDAAFGWRPIGNAMVSLSPYGKLELEKFLNQKNDKWLAWFAYEVLYLKQTQTNENTGFNLVKESKAIFNQENYAPTFPGWRIW